MDSKSKNRSQRHKLRGAKRPAPAPNGPEGQRRRAPPEKLGGSKTAAAASLHPVKAKGDISSSAVTARNARSRKPRADAGSFKVSARDLELLRFVGEQYAVTLPQLA